MDEFLVKKLIMKKHNTAIRAQREKKAEKLELLKKTKEYQKMVLEKNNEQEQKIKELNEKLHEVEKERDFYKISLEKIPKFIVRIFVRKTKLLEGEK